MANQPDPMTFGRLERRLAGASVACFGLSLAAIFAVIVSTAVHADTRQGLWPTVFLVPLIGFPLTILCIIGVLVTTAVHRSRAVKGDGR